LLPSRLAMMFLVQWWLIGPPGRSTTRLPAAVICVAPVVYGKRTIASALATYRSPPTRAMPNGENRFCRNTCFCSAMPSPSPSRSRVMRFGLGTPAPARFITSFMTHFLMPPESSFGGAFDSATSTSPLGSTCSQRGCSRPPANSVTVRPAAGVGLAPCGQPFAGAMSTVGISVLFGCGSCGFGPMPASAGSLAVSPHAARASARAES
jgi:hypothetical protein